jgi:hypothetical protein
MFVLGRNSAIVWEKTPYEKVKTNAGEALNA